MRRVVAAVCAAMGLIGVVTVLPLSDAGALAPHRVSIAVSKGNIDFGSAVRVFGSVPTASPGKVVYIDQLAGTSWRQIASGRTSATRAYAVNVSPRSGGFVRFRARVGADRSRAAGYSGGATVAVYRWRYLADLRSVSGNISSGQERINGVTYPFTLVKRATCGFSECGSAEFDLRRQCTTFAAVVGILDTESSSSRAVVTIASDGIEKFLRTMQFGEQTSAVLNIAGRLRLSFRNSPVSGFDDARVGFGRARIRCLW